MEKSLLFSNGSLVLPEVNEATKKSHHAVCFATVGKHSGAFHCLAQDIPIEGDPKQRDLDDGKYE